MRIALDGPMLVFGGPYSNLQATQAVLAEAARRGIPPANILCTGDVVAYGADAAACCDLVMGSGIFVIAGNCEEQLAEAAGDCGCGFEEGTACDLLSRSWYAHANAEVTPAQRDWMRALPKRIVLALPDGRRLAVLHGGASETSRFLFASTPDSVLAEEIAATGCDGVIAGHCGLPFARRVGDALWLNAGAVGMPADDGTPRVWFAVLTPGPDGLGVEILPLDYDHAAAAAAMRAARLPEGYAAALSSGIWPSADVLPAAERARRGQALAPVALMW
ncbi:metallophosphoesterase family protein [Falsiroseomonas tokyonensis]|uniref:Metallophosphoesterase family protein n=1 Tax=Falsiroseomonas tokyonensis TaxID=430521 RepID=A0ABV7BNT3_9PROT|nr:metallophosphoesterase family protein [Falsiroseomonas tokyonensis]MBU8537257.1 metallophosphoesterase family protein [Falsiroseomonas tokyonensis]